MDPNPAPRRNLDTHHVVIVGSGFAGLACALGLKGSGARITIIDKRNHHLFQPLLYQVATTILPTSDIAWPIRKIMRNRADVTTLMAKVTAVDAQAREVTLDCGGTVGYDTLVLATGATHSYFGKDSWEAFAPGLKTLEDATTIRRRILTAFEAAERAKNSAAQIAEQTYVVVGGGPTGVELVGVIAELAHRVLPQEFRRIDTRSTRVILVEAGPRVLPQFPEKLSNYAKRALEDLGVEVMVDTRVTDCDAEGVVLEDKDQAGTRLPAKTVIWAAGVRASEAGSWIAAQTDRAGRTEVAEDLTVPGRPEIFVLGDTAAVTSEGKPVPGIAPAAKQMGQYAAKVISARLGAQSAPRPFRYKHAGNLATIGPNSAVVDLGWTQLKGSLAWWFWGIAHVYFLIDTRSRIAVAFSWLWSYITGLNSARLITQKPARDLDR
jgi:NADH dehydrogenase